MAETRDGAAAACGTDVAAWVSLALAIVLLNAGNLLLDEVAKASGIELALFLSPLFVAAIGCLGLAFLFYVRSLARLPLAVAYPVMVGLSMIVVAVANHYWHKPLATVQLAGVALLFCGVVLISTSSRSA
jgi:multidrug transporter EmrE-like cation transporter